MRTTKRINLLLAAAVLAMFIVDIRPVSAGQPAERQLRLDKLAASASWYCSNGSEYPGARGSIKASVEKGREQIQLNYDFTRGGNYVAAVRLGVLPLEAGGLAVRLKALQDCTIFFRVVGSGRTFQGFYQKFKADEEKTVRLYFKGPWRHSWGSGSAKSPQHPIRGLWVCVQKTKALPAKGVVEIRDLTATSRGTLADLRQLGSMQNFDFTAAGWQVTGKWMKNWTVLKIDCHALTGADAVFSIAFPRIVRDDVKRFNLTAARKEHHITYVPPLEGLGNPKNRYAIQLNLKSGKGEFNRTIVLAGKDSAAVNLGEPIHSKKIKKSIVGTNTHFSFAPVNTGAFADWHKHRELTDMIAAAGIKWIRDMVSTKKDENGQYKVREFVLNWMRYARKQGINLVAGISMGSNETPEEFAKKCRAIAEQTKGLAHVFELGNEPQNFGGWVKKFGGTWNGKEKDNSTSAWVKAFLKNTNAGAEAIKKVRPDAICVGLGACAPTNFRMLDLGVTEALDGVVEHPYSFSMPPEIAPYGWGFEKRDGIRTGDEKNTFIGLIQSYVEKFRATGKMRTIWITEFGQTARLTGPAHGETGLHAGFSEKTQAIYLVRQFIQSMTLPVIKSACQYDFLQDYGGALFNGEANFGMVRPDYTPRPSYYAVQRMASLFAGYEHDKKVKVKVEKAPVHRSVKRRILIDDWDGVVIKADNGVHSYGFKGTDLPNERLLAVWSALPASGEFNNRFVSIRITGWKKFNKHPLAIDLITGKSFDLPVKVDGEDLILDILLTDHPLVIKVFRK